MKRPAQRIKTEYTTRAGVDYTVETHSNDYVYVGIRPFSWSHRQLQSSRRKVSRTPIQNKELAVTRYLHPPLFGIIMTDKSLWVQITLDRNKSDERVQCPDCGDSHRVDSLTRAKVSGRDVCPVCWEYDSGESLVEYLGFSVSGRWLPG